MIDIDQRERGFVASFPVKGSGLRSMLASGSSPGDSPVFFSLSRPVGALLALGGLLLIAGEASIPGGFGRNTPIVPAMFMIALPVLQELDFRVRRQRRFPSAEDAPRIQVVVDAGQVTIDSFSAPLHDCRLAAIGTELHALRPSDDTYVSWNTMCSELTLRRLVQAFDEERQRFGSADDVPEALRSVEQAARKAPEHR